MGNLARQAKTAEQHRLGLLLLHPAAVAAAGLEALVLRTVAVTRPVVVAAAAATIVMGVRAVRMEAAAGVAIRATEETGEHMAAAAER